MPADIPAPDEGPDESEVLQQLAASTFRGLSETLLRELAQRLGFVQLGAGEAIFALGDEADALYLVVRGELEAWVPKDDGGELVLSRMGPGTTAGEIQLVMGGRRSASVRASSDTLLGRLDRDQAKELVGRHPAILESVAVVIRERMRRDELVQLLPHLFGSIDEDTLREVEQATEWVSIPRGERLIRQGDPGERVYFLVNGRMRAVNEQPGQPPQVLSEITRGELVGEMSLFSGKPCTASVYAQRDSELASIDFAGFEALVARHPHMLRAITRKLVQRVEGDGAPAERLQHVAILPLDDEVPVRAFSARLAAALSQHASVFHLTAEVLDAQLGMAAAQLPADDHYSLRTRAWMFQLQAQYRFVIAEADPGDSEWTRRCLRNADEILLLGRGTADPEPGPVERALLAEGEATAARTRLVLLHEDPQGRPHGTRHWLAPRRVELHHHVRWWDPDACIARLGRFLRGQAVGLALSGGGARGMAHIGVLRALGERGVPIDFIGGTSAGGMVAGQHAMGRAPQAIHERMKSAMDRHKPFCEFNIPLVSLVGAKRMRRVSKELYQDLRIEDLWLNSFYVSCGLSTGAEPAAVVLFSHGLGGSRRGSAFLGRHWAARGFVAVFLQHPGSDESVWRDKRPLEAMRAMREAASGQNLLLRAADVGAALDLLATWNTDPEHELHGRLDLERVGMAGHSFGAVTTQAVSGQSQGLLGARLRDERVDAALALSPSTPRFGKADEAFASVAIPWMLMNGTHDESPIGGQTPATRREVYPALPATIDRYELVLDRAEHSIFTERSLRGEQQQRNPNHHPAILALSTAFWDAHLAGDEDARRWLQGDGPGALLEEADHWQADAAAASDASDAAEAGKAAEADEAPRPDEAAEASHAGEAAEANDAADGSGLAPGGPRLARLAVLAFGLGPPAGLPARTRHPVWSHHASTPMLRPAHAPDPRRLRPCGVDRRPR